MADDDIKGGFLVDTPWAGTGAAVWGQTAKEAIAFAQVSRTKFVTGLRARIEKAEGVELKATAETNGRVDAQLLIKHPDADRTETEDLYGADPKCRHLTVCAPGGGIMCLKCPGWFCY